MRQHEAKTHYDAAGRIVFTPKGLPGVRLARRAVRGDTSYTLRTPDGRRRRTLGKTSATHPKAASPAMSPMTPTPIERQMVYRTPLLQRVHGANEATNPCA